MDPTTPKWFHQLVWSSSHTVAAVNVQRKIIPHKPGVYVFSKAPFKGPGGVLYVGIAESNLATRLPHYLAPAEKVKIWSRKHPDQISSSLGHAGKVQILMEAMHSGGNNVWLSWTCYPQPKRLEGALIEWLRPAYNSRHEPILLMPNDTLP